jgi:predicted RNA binding protein YcfA (HicA-like mRNA interferase family)
MTKIDKLINKILLGNTTISTDEAIKVLLRLGYEVQKQNAGTSHITYKKQGDISITLVLNRKELKKYQIKAIQELLNHEGYKND